MNHPRPAAVAAAVAAFGAVVAVGSAGPVVLPSAGAPPAVEALGPLEGVLALALSPDGTSAAAAMAASGPGRSLLRLVTPERREAETMELPGVARSLLFSPDGRRVYALLEKPRRKGPGEVLLYDIDAETLRSGARILLPDSARALAIFIGDGALLLACQDEIRSFRLPALSSGPLYRIPGENLAIADLGGGDLLVGQADGLLRVHLRDAQGREGLDPRERVATAEPVVGLAAAPDGGAALVRLAGGSIHRVALAPLRVEETGLRGTAVAWLGAAPARRLDEERPPPEATAIEGGIAKAAAEPPSGAGAGAREETETVVATGEPRAQFETAPAAGGELRTRGQGEGAVQEKAAPPAEEALPEGIPRREAPAPSPPPEGVAGGAVSGRLSGPAVAGVAAVVLAGPDDLLRTARRVKPSPEGSWSADGLAAGLYRVVLVGEGGRAVVTEPAFQTVRVEAGSRVELPEIRAIRLE